MTERFHCSRCGYEAERASVDKPVSCPSCGQATGEISQPAAPEQALPPVPARQSGRKTALYIVAGLLVVGLLVLLLLPAVESARPAARRMYCANNLKQIGFALDLYKDKYGSFPPAYSRSADGQPATSWRVLLLPFMDKPALYERYRRDESWNSPANVALIEQFPSPWRCLSDSPPSSHTSYVMVLGPNTAAGDGGQRLPTSEPLDDPSTTILVVEWPGSDIPWTEPRDVAVDQLLARIGNPQSETLGHEGGFHALHMDGSVQFISYTDPPADLRHMLTANDGLPRKTAYPRPVE